MEVVVTVFITAAATLQELLSVAAAVLFCGDELMQKEGTNSAALTFRVENLLSIDDLSCDVGGPTISPLLSACCSHESGAMLFAILISCFGTAAGPQRLTGIILNIGESRDTPHYTPRAAPTPGTGLGTGLKK